MAGNMSGKQLRLVGLLLLVLLTGLGIVAISLDANRDKPEQRPPEPVASQAIDTSRALPIPSHEVHLTVSPPTATIREQDTVLGQGSAVLLLAMDATTPRRITLTADGYTSRTQELSPSSPDRIHIELEALPAASVTSPPPTPEERPAQAEPVATRSTSKTRASTTQKKKPTPPPSASTTQPDTSQEGGEKEKTTAKDPGKKEPSTIDFKAFQ